MEWEGQCELSTHRGHIKWETSLQGTQAEGRKEDPSKCPSEKGLPTLEVGALPKQKQFSSFCFQFSFRLEMAAANPRMKQEPAQLSSVLSFRFLFSACGLLGDTHGKKDSMPAKSSLVRITGYCFLYSVYLLVSSQLMTTVG